MAEEQKEVSSSKSIDNIVELHDVVLSNDAGPLLSAVNFSIQRGEFVYLIGRSGTGKTTLIRSLYGDVELSAGRGTVCGFQLETLKRRQVPKLRRRMGIVFQNFRLLHDRDVYENLDFVLRSTGWNKSKLRNEQILKVLRSVGLEKKSDLMPDQLSEGEQQRVGIARALINNPELIVADEPTGNLDPVTSSEIMDMLVNVCREEGRTVLISTHDFMMIDKYQSRVLCCENGTVTVS
ncbi:MAG: ATP-binding cassette domain-containing protein [Bacteroidales bacterium]|nr:ATP-binding cassette domain-containing protein [Bacteroidales bacterium]